MNIDLIRQRQGEIIAHFGEWTESFLITDGVYTTDRPEIAADHAVV